MRYLLALFLGLIAADARAQPAPSNMTGGYWAGGGCNLVAFGPPNGARAMMVDQNGNLCTTNSGSNYTGNGTLSVTTSSARINTMTANSSSAPLPANLTGLTIRTSGTGDAAICPNAAVPGATCTCPENGAAATNGVTLPGGKGGYVFNLGGVSSANPTIVACSSTVLVEFQW